MGLVRVTHRWVEKVCISSVVDKYAALVNNMAGVSQIAKALKILQEEGCEDLLQVGVLEQDLVGLNHPEHLLAERVAVAVMMCSAPAHKLKKYKQKSAGGWWARVLPAGQGTGALIALENWSHGGALAQ
ncbi:hypothetical protein NDU88_003194 [Pleurodeles waltl]|uniref:Uncharacterized protein n=1 Tax=Pleurodeles waltl TaxID=8319 RepID=A0AAV7M4J1_PLEWA|nr:hypothetical protein NDU88_003194 [Pleurodeles waltl]